MTSGSSWARCPSDSSWCRKPSARYLARELHDELGQLLTATKLTFQAVHRSRASGAGSRKLREGLALLDQCLQQVRSLSLELRPSLLDDLGLGPALRCTWTVTPSVPAWP